MSWEGGEGRREGKGEESSESRQNRSGTKKESG